MPLARFFSAQAPEIEVTNLLDDGLLRLFRAGDAPRAKARLLEMLHAARETYAAEAAMLTCSAIPSSLLAELRAECGIPIFKIDEPMARLAVAAGRKVAVAATFAPAVETARALLEEAAAEAGREIEVTAGVADGAYEALLRGDAPRHDEIVLALIPRLAAASPDAIVLAQVSMAHLSDRVRALTAAPVFSSLETSLAALRALLEKSR